MLQHRPRVDPLPRGSFDSWLDFMSTAAIVAGALVVANAWSSLPAVIPTHFGADGQVNGFGPRATLLMLPSVALLMFVMLEVLQRYPRIYNYAWPITEENAARQYALASRLMGVIRAMLVCLFSYVSWQTTRAAAGDPGGLGAGFLPLMLLGTFGPLVWYLIAAGRAR